MKSEKTKDMIKVDQIGDFIQEIVKSGRGKSKTKIEIEIEISHD